MKFALVTADPSNMVRYRIDPEQGDATSFLNWIDVWQGYQFSYDAMRKDCSCLADFDVVMMSGHPHYPSVTIEIAKFLKNTNTVSMYYPEGSLQLYDNSINGFHHEHYEAWNACDILSSAEEDKIVYYESFIRSETIVRFIHVPLRKEMEDGEFFIPQIHKSKNMAVVYGDNNPNHPMIALACAQKLGMDVIGIDIDRGKSEGIARVFPKLKIVSYPKLATYPFLRLLGRSFLHFYPTEWIGTAREQISCAVVGTPCIGNSRSHTQKRLFPKILPMDIYDIKDMTDMAKELLNNENFYRDCAEYARNAVRFYGLEATKKRFTDAVEEARSIKAKRRILLEEPIS